MNEDSGNSRLNIKKYIHNFLLCVLTLAIIVILSIAFLIGYMFYAVHIPSKDSVYIGYMEFYAGDSLPSCKVIRKKYDGSSYTTALYRVNDSDFEKVLNGVQTNKYLKTVTSVYFNDVAIQLLRKEKIYDISQLDYSYSLFGNDVQIGFKRPDIILYFRRIND